MPPGFQAARRVFAANVRRIRAQQGITQERLAELCGLHRTYIGSIERGEQNISLENIGKVAATLGVSLAELFSPFTDAAPSP